MRASVTRESLTTQADHVLQEARVLLPGVQTLFGFQLIAVFSERFEALTPAHQNMHLASLFAIAIAIALIMAPAVYHRQAEPGVVSATFLRFSSRCLTATAVPLLVGISLEFYLVATLIAPAFHVNAVLTGVVLVTFLGLWFVFPRWKRSQRGSDGERDPDAA